MGDELRWLYREHVRPLQPGGDWRGPCHAVVPVAIAPDVRQAMDSMGSKVDGDPQSLPDGRVRLRSLGYWVHGS